MGKPKKLYANGVNLSGLWWKTPRVMTLGEGSEYWDSEGDFDVEGPGESIRYGYVTFASRDRATAVAWTNGVRAAMKLLREWSV